jgi:hypothetical protein
MDKDIQEPFFISRNVYMDCASHAFAFPRGAMLREFGIPNAKYGSRTRSFVALRHFRSDRSVRSVIATSEALDHSGIRGMAPAPQLALNKRFRCR